MDSVLSVNDLGAFHPNLRWDEIAIAPAAIVGKKPEGLIVVQFSFENMPAFGTANATIGIDISDVSPANIERMQRTYELARLVELAAIAVAGIGIYYGGGHEIMDISARGSAADYLVDTTLDRLEIAGRSRRRDVQSAWQTRWDRLSARDGGFYVCLVEFETLSARFAYSG